MALWYHWCQPLLLCVGVLSCCQPDVFATAQSGQPLKLRGRGIRLPEIDFLDVWPLNEVHAKDVVESLPNVPGAVPLMEPAEQLIDKVMEGVSAMSSQPWPVHSLTGLTKNGVELGSGAAMSHLEEIGSKVADDVKSFATRNPVRQTPIGGLAELIRNEKAGVPKQGSVADTLTGSILEALRLPLDMTEKFELTVGQLFPAELLEDIHLLRDKALVPLGELSLGDVLDKDLVEQFVSYPAVKIALFDGSETSVDADTFIPLQLSLSTVLGDAVWEAVLKLQSLIDSTGLGSFDGEFSLNDLLDKIPLRDLSLAALEELRDAVNIRDAVEKFNAQLDEFEDALGLGDIVDMNAIDQFFASLSLEKFSDFIKGEGLDGLEIPETLGLENLMKRLTAFLRRDVLKAVLDFSGLEKLLPITALSELPSPFKVLDLDTIQEMLSKISVQELDARLQAVLDAQRHLIEAVGFNQEAILGSGPMKDILAKPLGRLVTEKENMEEAVARMLPGPGASSISMAFRQIDRFANGIEDTMIDAKGMLTGMLDEALALGKHLKLSQFVDMDDQLTTGVKFGDILQNDFKPWSDEAVAPVPEAVPTEVLT